jgi:hypothetical protein
MIAALTQALNAARPFIQLAAVLAGLMTAWSFVSDLVPVLKQVYTVRTPLLNCAAATIALALVGK